MRLFSEKVKPTLTDSPLNILQVNHFDEVFFGVYEVEINKTKYPVEKVSEHNGNPVVSVPVVIEGNKSFYPFVLTKGKPEILFNENNTMDAIVDSFEPIEVVEYNPIEEVSLQPIFESQEEPLKIDDVVDNRSEILEQIEKAKLNAKKEVQKFRIQKQKELQTESANKQKLLEETLHDARSEMVEEFVKISQKIKGQLVDANDERFFEIEATIDNKIQDLATSLGESLVSNFENSNKDFDSKLKEMVKEMYSTINPKIDEELKNIATEIVEKVDSIEKNLDSKLDIKADKTLLEGLNREMDAIRDGNIELNDKINKGVNKSLSRVGNIDKRVDELTIALSEDVESKISKAEENITNYYSEKLRMLEEKTFDITEETRKYIVNLVQESKNNLIEEVRKLKNEKPIEYIVEAKGKSQKINSDDLVKDFDKKINSKIDNEVTRLRKYIAVYSGGGSVAQQFADGGTMNGNLTVVGTISASQYLGLPSSGGATGAYLPLSGGTLTGNLSVVGAITSVDSIKFNTTSTVAVTSGQLTWNPTDGTVDIGMGFDGVVQQVGLEQYIKVTADGAIRDGSVVWYTGTTGNSTTLKGKMETANANQDPKHLLGVATQDIANGAQGFITTFGIVRSANITGLKPAGETWVEGDRLYASPTINGGWTNVEPSAPNLKMPLAFLLFINNNNNPTNVSMFVRRGNTFRLENLHNVYDTTYTHPDGSLLAYNTALSCWKPSLSASTSVDRLSANYIYTTQLEALSANITVVDIKQYELSGFNVIGDSTIQGNVSASGNITAETLKISNTFLSRSPSGALQVGISALSANGTLALSSINASGIIGTPQIAAFSNGTGGSVTFAQQALSLRTGTGFIVTLNNTGFIPNLDTLTLGSASVPWGSTFCRSLSSSGTVIGTNLVYLTTDQTIAGAKTFSDNIVGNGTVNTLANQTRPSGNEGAILTVATDKFANPYAYSTLTTPSSSVAYLPLGFNRLNSDIALTWGTNDVPAPMLPFLITKSFRKVTFNHTAGTHPSAVMEIAIYNIASDGKPTTLIEQGTVSLSATGVKTLTLSQSRSVNGLFVIAMRPSIGTISWTATGGSGTLTVRGVSTGDSPICGQIFGSINPTTMTSFHGTSLYSYSSLTHPFPSNLTNDAAVTLAQTSNNSLWLLCIHN